MTRSSFSRLAAATLTAAALGSSAGAFAYGTAAPMGVTGIEAQAPVTSLNATATVPAEPRARKAATASPARLRNWIAALRQRLDGAIEVALR